MKTFFASLLLLALNLTGQAQPLASLEEERLSQSGVAITIIFDDSGSMATENRMPQAKAAFQQWLGGIPRETKLGLITLNRGVLVPLGQNTRESIETSVAEMTPIGATPLTRTINLAGNLIQERRKNVTPYERHIVIVFTDGEDSEFSSDQVVESLKRLGNSTIETVGIGFHGEGDFMERGATQYYNAGDSTELVKALKEVASEVDQQSDIVVTPEIQTEMAKVNAAPAAAQPQERTDVPDRPKSFPFGTIIFLIIVCFVAYKIIKSMSGKSR